MYVDDVIVYSETFEDHLEHVDRVLTIVRDTVLALDIAKCHSFRAKFDYLGHIVVPRRLKVS